MTCRNCGTPIPDEADFCPECGTKVEKLMKKCLACGAELPEDADFCPECGTKVGGQPQNCPSCGAELPKEAVFCPKCGQAIGAGAPVRSAAPPAPVVSMPSGSFEQQVMVGAMYAQLKKAFFYYKLRTFFWGFGLLHLVLFILCAIAESGTAAFVFLLITLLGLGAACWLIPKKLNQLTSVALDKDGDISTEEEEKLTEYFDPVFHCKRKKTILSVLSALVTIPVTIAVWKASGFGYAVAAFFAVSGFMTEVLWGYWTFKWVAVIVTILLLIPILLLISSLSSILLGIFGLLI